MLKEGGKITGTYGVNRNEEIKEKLKINKYRGIESDFKTTEI